MHISIYISVSQLISNVGIAVFTDIIGLVTLASEWIVYGKHRIAALVLLVKISASESARKIYGPDVEKEMVV